MSEYANEILWLRGERAVMRVERDALRQEMWLARQLTAMEAERNAMRAERDELRAAIGTIREVAGCKPRNVSDVDIPTHTREIGDALRARVEAVRALPRYHIEEGDGTFEWSEVPDADGDYVRFADILAALEGPTDG